MGILNLSHVYRRILGRVLVGNILNIKNESLIFLGSWGPWIVSRNKQIAREPLRACNAILCCPALRFIPHEPRKKDTHSLTEWKEKRLNTPTSQLNFMNSRSNTSSKYTCSSPSGQRHVKQSLDVLVFADAARSMHNVIAHSILVQSEFCYFLHFYDILGVFFAH